MLKLFLILIALGGVACTKSTPSNSEPQTPQALAEKGKKVYGVNCIACHAADPKVDGAVGPALYGASLDLLQHRVLKVNYPEGYKPKRTSHIMPPFPYLKDDIPALHAYLNSP